MGQKANPVSLQVGTKKNWKTEYSEKKMRDPGFIAYQDSSAFIFVARFFEKHGFYLQDHRLHYHENGVKLFLSIYSITAPNLHGVGKVNKRTDSAIVLKKCHKVVAVMKGPAYRRGPKITEPVVNKLHRCLSLFFGNKRLSITISYASKFLNLSSKESRSTKKHALSLRRFKKEEYFREMFETSFAISKSVHFSRVLLKVLLKLIRTTRKIYRPLKMLKKSLQLFLNNPLRGSSGVKIELRGRLNGARRKKIFRLIVGDVACHSKNVDLDYEVGNTQNKHGSFGVRVWVINKKKLASPLSTKNVSTTKKSPA